MKICSCCKVSKETSEFSIVQKRWVASWCKLCSLAWNAAKREAGLVNDYHREYQRQRRKNPEVRRANCEMTKIYYRKNRREVLRKGNIRRQVRYKTDPDYRLLESLRNRVRLAMKRKSKAGSTLTLLGCSPSQLRDHLSAQFKPGMTWENYGEWHVDHKLPCASFNLADPEQQRQCFHFSNLQPLWKIENLTKGAKTGTI